MDYEDILFGLQPVLNASSIKDVPIQDIYLQSYITVLDQLAVSLRAPTNRDIIRETGLLVQILRVLDDTLDVAVHDRENINNIKYWKLASELIRCVANCLVDNNKNRCLILKISEKPAIPSIAQKVPLLDYYMIKILTSLELPNDNEGDLLKDLQMRSIVLLKNLCLENNQYARRIAKVLLGPLLTYLRFTQHTFQDEPDNMVLATDLLIEFCNESSTGFSLDSLLFLTKFSKKIATVIESIPQGNDNEVEDKNGPTVGETEIEDDPYSEMLFSLTESIEIIVTQQDNSIDFTTEGTSQVQTELLLISTILNDKFFANKLIVMRRLVSITGHISAIPTNDNVTDRPLCYQIIRKSKEEYTIAAALIILSNSINSREDVNIILKEIALDDIMKLAKYIRDPLEYQGYLDILKKLLNISNAMFLSNETVIALVHVLITCTSQAQFFPNLTVLIDNLLKKLITVLPSQTLFRVLEQDNKTDQNQILKFIKERGSFVSCLVTDKLLVAKQPTSESILNDLWSTIFKMQETVDPSQTNGNVTISFLFQMTKTIGIYLRQCVTNESEPKVMFIEYSEPLHELLQTILPLGSNNDKGSESVFNNGKFIAGMIQKIVNKIDVKTPEEIKLADISRQFF